MIWNALVDILCDLFDSMISFIPLIAITIPDSFFDGLNTLVQNVGYILPIDDLMIVFDLWIAYLFFRLCLTFYKRRIKLKV